MAEPYWIERTERDANRERHPCPRCQRPTYGSISDCGTTRDCPACMEADERIRDAAPALLEAAKAAFEDLDDHLHGRKPRHHALELSKMLRAAVNRAEGRA